MECKCFTVCVLQGGDAPIICRVSITVLMGLTTKQRKTYLPHFRSAALKQKTFVDELTSNTTPRPQDEIMWLLGQHVGARMNFMCGGPVKEGDESYVRLTAVAEDESLHREVRAGLARCRDSAS